MKRTLILPVALLLAVVVAAPVMSQSEELSVGVSLNGMQEDEALDAAQIGFNVGYRFLNILLADWSAVSLPPGVVANITGYEFTDDNGNKFYVPGVDRPGFANFFDIGLALNIGPFVGTAQAGLNFLYIYKQDELESYDGSAGANLRVGAGVRFDWWSVIINGTVVFADLTTALQTLSALSSEDDFLRERAEDKLQSGLMLALSLNMYL